jgi:4'-phosphopantetheinyl transferase
LEHYLLKSATSDEERKKIFFWMWTVKEAYTKALGIGLGFDFSRIEFDVPNKIVRVDKKIPQGWRFDMFEIKDSDDLYEGVVAEYLGEGETIVTMHDVPEWLTVFEAVPFTENAINTLNA